MAKILVVDDDETDRILIGRMLESEGHEVVYARDGRDALRVLEKIPGLDAIITDLRMPFLHGLELIQDRREAGDSIPIIAVSGVEAIQLSVARDHGADSTLAKPLDRGEFLQAVRSATDATDSGWDGAWISVQV